MRIALVMVGTLLFGSLAAQDPVDPKPQAKVSAAECAEQLQEMQSKAIADWRAARKAASNPEPGQKVKAVRMRPDFGPVAKQANVYAKQFAGTDDAVQFLMMAVMMGSDKMDQKAGITELLKSHIDSPELAQMGRMLPSLPRMIDEDFAQATMTRMMESKNADVVGWALLAMHKSTIETADLEGKEYIGAKKALMAASKGVADQRLAQQMMGAIDEREKFGVGCTSPDIAGIDLDGVEFKLSDYKGKVIFLDFWGDW